MNNEMQEKKLKHPEGKILLMNGNLLDCFPREDRPRRPEPDPVRIDTTGVFLRTGGAPATGPGIVLDAPWMELFYGEAFFLYEHRDAVFADSRMFLTPLPFGNNLAYSGTSGLRDATLGVYLEWWDACERAVIRKDGEAYALTYLIAGSPLSGSNRCGAVTRTGERKTVVFDKPFSDIWGSFMTINGRYTEARQIYRAYSLEETLGRLHAA